MSEPAVGGSDGEFLTVRVGAKGHERLLLISRPQSERVNVREWTTQTWSQEGANYETSSAELLEQIETAYAKKMTISEEMHLIRLWLRG